MFHFGVVTDVRIPRQLSVLAAGFARFETELAELFNGAIENKLSICHGLSEKTLLHTVHLRDIVAVWPTWIIWIF